ncbi:MAG: hypothetical protein UV74_C0013G0065 [Candidatus Woesebacteria bacterium GW2011_GWB1_43_14]|uniref:Smf/DprA SLOG domain-containing protein n=1 Tax=Candidatus Woesebacteria bacterium GW2011_GWB1_43_14 TaxID=1618578 RepID=A0A0G1GDI3_9BACT|nr:MAG: hypothetical protein UT21_C0004G0010 [Candidatus Woesebacteria bacterium GW2011_GWA1_39_11b]KKS77749.1 MAG: hypothetical protein UV51_C0005G0159 [Candidatus Woesebacteria bacterium GW2011_GWC1_42_9]KKS96943.1 MAG: hypothetical protein UV74_C0013G0065 [Candidatus Woesebacteria bacterium GW2011_GWB1_43_14]
MKYLITGLLDKKASGYPKNLSGLIDPPEIYVKGEIRAEDQMAIAVVGTRNPSKYGMEMAKIFTRALASNGVTIVSGLARGVDTIAHKTALDVSGRTIAVFGSGLNIIYPPENRKLADRILENGALISEFPEDTKPLPKNFLARNRIISGLSLGVLVIEGGNRSGTLSTAAHAANQGREVFAIPGRVDNPASFAPNFLIENGAKMVRTPKDILDAFV